MLGSARCPEFHEIMADGPTLHRPPPAIRALADFAIWYTMDEATLFVRERGGFMMYYPPHAKVAIAAHVVACAGRQVRLDEVGRRAGAHLPEPGSPRL